MSRIKVESLRAVAPLGAPEMKAVGGLGRPRFCLRWVRIGPFWHCTRWIPIPPFVPVPTPWMAGPVPWLAP